MPFFWGTVAKNGQIYGDPNSSATALLTNGLNDGRLDGSWQGCARC